MSKKKILAILTGTATVATAIAAYEAKKKADKTTYEANLIEPIKKRKRGIYEKYIKRALDVICATGAIVVFSPVYLGVAVLVKLKLGSPVLFTQDRPGLIGKDGRETVFKMYKFRTMTDERDENGELLPDEARLTKFGKWLRNTSLDELPEAFNILNGTMSVIGPRPQLVRDMVFMTDEQRLRHTAKPGLSGLAQVNGRNAISWEDKLEWDLKYIRNISLAEDIKIILATVKKAFIKQEGITQDDMATAEDFGDYLLRNGKIDEKAYGQKQEQAKKILSGEDEIRRELGLVSIIMPSYNTAAYIKESIQSVLNQTSLSLLTATIIENGSLRRYFTLFYPLIALCCLVTVQLRNEKKMTEFINAISNLFFVLCLLNLVCILYNSQLFGMDTYLIGIKNQIGYALNIGLLLVYMDAYIRRDKFKLHVYICIYFLTVVKVASSSSFIGASIILLYFLVPFIRKMILKIDFRIMLIGYIFLFVGIVFFSTVVLNLEPVKFFIEDILGKNVTLTNRTVIWVKVISGIIQKPFLGHGIQESSNLFYIHIDFWNRVAVDGTYSAHNQILQTLYEGGTIAIALIFSLLWHVGKEIKECSNDNISSICKLMLIVTLVMMLAESPGLDSLLIIVTLVSVFVKKMKIEG